MKKRVMIAAIAAMVAPLVQGDNIAYTGPDEGILTSGANWEGGAVPSIANGHVGTVTDQPVVTAQYVTIGTVVFAGSASYSRGVGVADNLRLRNANWTFEGTSTLTMAATKKIYMAQSGGDGTVPVVINWNSAGTLQTGQLHVGVSNPAEFNQSAGLVQLGSSSGWDKVYLFANGT